MQIISNDKEKLNEMAYYDGEFDQFLEDRLKQSKPTHRK